ncbi:MAG: HdeA/HdeB family chaperone [Rhodospirillaceae bacterium]
MLAVIALAALSVNGSVQAAEGDVNMAKITCEQAVQMGDDFMSHLLFWVDGYISREHNDTIMSKEWIEEMAGIITKGCGSNPSGSVLKIVRDSQK